MIDWSVIEFTFYLELALGMYDWARNIPVNDCDVHTLHSDAIQKEFDSE